MINIIETKINYDLLNKDIKYYEIDHNERVPNYLIMNLSTREIMRKDSGANAYIASTGAFYGTYHGIPIAVCNKLEDGEVDVI